MNLNWHISQDQIYKSIIIFYTHIKVFLANILVSRFMACVEKYYNDDPDHLLSRRVY